MWKDDSNERVFLALILASVVAHAAAVELLPSGQHAAMAAPLPPSQVMVTLAPLPPAPAPQPAPVAEMPSAPVRPVQRAPRRAARPSPSPQAVSAAAMPVTDAPPAPAGEAVADFSGLTLTSPDGGVPVGGGGGGGGHAPVQRRGFDGGDTLVSLGELSRAPEAPALDGALARNYPAWARDHGASGTAVVRARVSASGRVDTVRILTASADGFGEACRRTLLGSVWQPPLDRDGRAVATEISYTCRFEVSQ